MNAPLRAQGKTDVPLPYAPRRERRLPPSRPEPFIFAAAPPLAPATGGPETDRPVPRSRPFEGDVAIKDLRRRLSLDPELVPQPPVRPRRNLWMGAWSLAALKVAVIGVLVMTVPDAAWQSMDRGSDDGASLREDVSRTRMPARPARLVVENQKGLANEPLPLGISLAGATGGETIMLAGLAAGTELSAGTRLGLTRWRVPAHDLGMTLARSPKDFVGAMDVMVDLRSAGDRLLDSQVVRLEWVTRNEDRSPPEPEPAKPPASVQPLDPETISKLEHFLKAGDILSARILLKRAAGAGSGEAALKLGMTFDPVFLARAGAVGFASDAAEARAWYERAIELGAIEAWRRLERLPGR